MAWSPLTSRVLNVDWPRSPAASIDPYLVWADATGLAGVRPAIQRAREGHATPESTLNAPVVSIAFELRTPFNFEILQSALSGLNRSWPWALVGIGSRFGTLQVPVGLLGKFVTRPLCDHFARIELGLPIRAGDGAACASTLNKETAEANDESKSRVYAAIIDDGCAFANHAFLRPGAANNPPHSRIERLWFQEDRLPVEPGLGHLGYARRHLDHFLRQAWRTGAFGEGSAYAALESDLRNRSLPAVADSWRRQMRQPATHGTHLLDVLAGTVNPWGRPRYGYGLDVDAASTAGLMFIQLPRAAVEDTSGGSMNCNVLDALAYIAHAVRKRDKVIVNLSYGALAGPHDGTTLLEEAIDDFLAHHSNIEALTLPAGNGYDSRTHACVNVALGRPEAISFESLPDDPTDTFVELWYPSCDDAKLAFKVTSPDGHDSGWVGLGEFVEWQDGGGDAIAALMHLQRPNAGGGAKYMALLALGPTRTQRNQRAIAPHGRWNICVKNDGAAAVAVDAWVERDDSSFGAGRSRSQSVFLSPGTPPARGQPHAAIAPIDRRSCLNSFAHGAKPRVAGGSTWRAAVAGEADAPLEAVARYSASGPGRKAALGGPDLCAPCEEFRGVGVLAAGTRSVQPVYLDGTSVAAATLARQLVNLACKGQPTKPETEEDELPPPRSGHDVPPLPPPELRRGSGRLKT